MKRDDVIGTLRAHEPELRAAGIVGLALFGSVARGDERPGSDVDVVVKLSDDPSRGGFAYFGLLDSVTHRLADILGNPVDIVAEPVRKPRLRRAIEKEGVRVF